MLTVKLFALSLQAEEPSFSGLVSFAIHDLFLFFHFCYSCRQRLRTHALNYSCDGPGNDYDFCWSFEFWRVHVTRFSNTASSVDNEGLVNVLLPCSTYRYVTYRKKLSTSADSFHASAALSLFSLTRPEVFPESSAHNLGAESLSTLVVFQTRSKSD